MIRKRLIGDFFMFSSIFYIHICIISPNFFICRQTYTLSSWEGMRTYIKLAGDQENFTFHPCIKESREDLVEFWETVMGRYPLTRWLQDVCTGKRFGVSWFFRALARDRGQAAWITWPVFTKQCILTWRNSGTDLKGGQLGLLVAT